MVWKVYWDIKNDRLQLGTEDQSALKFLKIFTAVANYMYNREILKDERAVIYAKDNKKVLWSFEKFDFPLNKKTKIQNLVSGKKYNSDKISAVGNEVYLIG